MDEMVLEGKTYVASRKAASECGYAQDYVGQLARKGFIDAKRVSGQWYVHLDSLKAYKEKAETFKPEPPKYQPDPNVEATLDVDGKEYVSAARAAKLTDYNQDYIAQLARAGKVPSRQIGVRWYIERDALLKHKHEKDAMLRAVQAESVGLKRSEALPTIARQESPRKMIVEQPLMSYAKESQPLFPVFSEASEASEAIALKALPDTYAKEEAPIGPTSRIPIRVLRPIKIQAKEEVSVDEFQPQKTVSIPRNSIFTGIFWRAAFSIVLLIAVGLGAYKRDAIYAGASETFRQAQTASTGDIATNVSNALEQLLTKELVYVRKLNRKNVRRETRHESAGFLNVSLYT